MTRDLYPVNRKDDGSFVFLSPAGEITLSPKDSPRARPGELAYSILKNGTDYGTFFLEKDLDKARSSENETERSARENMRDGKIRSMLLRLCDGGTFTNTRTDSSNQILEEGFQPPAFGMAG